MLKCRCLSYFLINDKEIFLLHTTQICLLHPSLVIVLLTSALCLQAQQPCMIFEKPICMGVKLSKIVSCKKFGKPKCTAVRFSEKLPA